MKKVILASAMFCSTALALSGCQSMSNTSLSMLDSIVQTDTVEIPENKVMQWSSGYNWQLTEVARYDGQPVTIKGTDPIRLAIDSGRLHFYQGCNHDKIDLFTGAPPYSYASYIVQLPATCTNSSTDDHNIRTLFQDYGTYLFGIKLLPTAPSTSQGNTSAAPKRLALIMENGNQLVFTGMAKTLPAPTGLPINAELLKRYDWHLVSAVDNHYDDKGLLVSRKPIGNFYHPDWSISVTFRDDSDQTYVSFNSGCNGSGAPYFLLDDNTLKVGMIISTMMGCGETGNRIETTIFNLMRDSSSQLSLSLQSSEEISTSSKNQTDMPSYNLLQTMESGETLVWQNQELPKRAYDTK